MYPTAPPTKRSSLFARGVFSRIFWISVKGSLVVSVVTLLVWASLILAFPFVTCIVVLGLNPMKEYWANFCGPSIDSRRYAFW